MTQIMWGPEAQDFVDKLPTHIRDRILKKMGKDIRADPKRYIEHLEGKDFGKIRIGDYRLFVDYAEAEQTLTVRSMRHRHNAYKNRGKNNKV